MRTFLLCCFLPTLISAHGSLVEPPSRAVMNSHGFPDSPPDYDWSAGYCGGKFHQWSPGIDGRCGICGDPWDAEVRQHEAPGGKFATGVIVRQYQSGQVIPVTTHITANHVGFLEFRLCSNNNVLQDPGQDCFDQQEAALTITQAGAGSYINQNDTTKLWIEDVGSGFFSAAVRLPDLECSQCILQWTYRNGRDWGTCNGACGQVETFRACADIAIIGSDHTTDTTENTEITMTETGEWSSDAVTEVVTTDPDSGEGETDCVAVGAWRGQPAMDAWCDLNCHNAQPFCPPDMCSCQTAGGAGGDRRTGSSQCAGLGPWADSTAVASWCSNNCLRHNSFCPASMCQCW